MMKKRLCNFLGLVLALSLMIPSGAIKAIAEEVTPAQTSSETTASSLVTTTSESEKKEVDANAVSSEENSQTVSENQPVQSVQEDEQANGTRAGPVTELVPDASFFSASALTTSLLVVSGTPKAVDVNITDFKIQNVDHQDVDTVFHSDTFLLNMKWNATGHGTNLHEGDYFDVDLPNNMKFPSGTTKTDFDITDDDGNVIAHAHITPGPNDTGGKIHVTFGPAVENKYNVKGTMNIAARFDQTKINKDSENKFEVTVNGDVPGKKHTANTGVKINGSKPIDEEYLTKWGQGTGIAGDTKAEWWSRINFSKANLTNAVVTDTLGSSGMTYIKDSFKLRKVVYDQYGETTQVVKEYTVDELINSGMLTFSADMSSFTLNLGNTSDQYRLVYRSTYVPGTTLKNRMRLDSDQKQKQVIASHKSAETGGHGSGDLASKIKIVKVDEDGTTPLKGAVFTVTKPDGTTFELTTGADGTIVSDLLEQGTYKVKEKTAPQGYELSDEEYTLEVTPTGGAIKKISNKPIKISVNVTKKWIGPKAGPVAVHLLADGTDTGKTLTLDEAGNWTGSFGNLPKYTEIVYTVKEDDVTNYTGAVTGDAASGFTITNTNTEKTSISGTKTWDDSNNQDGKRPSSITVNLLKNGTKVDSKTVTPDASGNWTYTFDNLDKYDSTTGAENTYTVSEEAVDGYTSTVTGTDIKNSYTPEVTTVKVSKTWVGPKAGPVTVHLLADGTDTGKTLTLDEAGNWTGSFGNLPKYSNLPKYKDGNVIAYTVKEDDVTNYTGTVTGDATSGFTITNTNTEKVDVPVTKTWVGPKGSSVTIHLLADGTDTGKILTLDEAGNWKGAFSGLDKYNADGTEIAYTVKEDEVAGYTSEVSGDATSGFTVTNTQIPPNTPPSTPKKKLPYTGDVSTLASIASFVAGSVALLGTGMALGRKRK
ncbi:Cna B-type domain-containing protein [Lancefieldella parvula]|uniref:Cna B-type domain-containing protein n=1 Tax=Lancefieldella parvula TaxID=1382 RepID=UPI00290E508E|nr:Cna B-type domain-containing protein [Lancefieldella parvula]MDU4868758.1 Cna B-type domain-containing protein [Lancefieldella parvula]